MLGLSKPIDLDGPNEYDLNEQDAYKTIIFLIKTVRGSLRKIENGLKSDHKLEEATEVQSLKEEFNLEMLKKLKTMNDFVEKYEKYMESASEDDWEVDNPVFYTGDILLGFFEGRRVYLKVIQKSLANDNKLNESKKAEFYKNELVNEIIPKLEKAQKLNAKYEKYLN